MNQSMFTFLGYLGFTGTLDERIRNYLLNIVGPALPSDTNNDLWMKLGAQFGYTGTINEIMTKWAIDNGSIGTTLNDAVAGLVNSPAALFANGENGVWYEPGDIASLFQSIGTSVANSIPVTASAQPVGFQVDKSQGGILGAEIMVNGDFSNGTTNWTSASATLTVVDGVGRHVASAINGSSQNLMTVDTTKYFMIDFDIVENTDSVTTTFSVREAATTTQCIAIVIPAGTTGHFSGVFRPTSNSSRVHFRSSNISTGYVGIDNVKVKEMIGNHAGQLTSTLRPQYLQTPDRLDYDGVDDVLTASFTPGLGANCTAIRSVPGVGAEITTGISIGITANFNQDNCGLVIVNRALTADETAFMTAWANQRAGV